MHAEQVGNAACSKAATVAAAFIVGIDGVGGQGKLAVIVLADSDKNASLGGQSIGGMAGPFECFPTAFQQQPLLGVHAHGFARGNSEEKRIKVIDLGQKSPFAHVHFSRCIGVGVVVGLDIPAFWRHCCDGIDTLVQEAPKGFWCFAATGQATAHADNGNWFLAGIFQGVEPGAQFLDGQCCPLQGSQLCVLVCGRGHAAPPSSIANS